MSFKILPQSHFANILSEARKYRLDLVLANQYITQIDEKVRDAIFGNAGTIIAFRVGAIDAEFLEKEFEPVFMQNDIVNLPKYNIYLKLMIDGIAGDAFSATTLPPVYIEDTLENEEKVIANSRERYASSKAEVEDKISKWAGMMPTSGFKTVNGAQNQEFQNQPQEYQRITIDSRPAQFVSEKQIHSQAQALTRPFVKEEPLPHVQNNIKPVIAVKQQEIENNNKTVFEEQQLPIAVPKPMFDAICDMCGEQIQVPFQPDGKRPTFCKECLKDYQRMTAKEKLAQERKIEREHEESQSKLVQSNKTVSQNPRFERQSNQHEQTPSERIFQPKSYASKERPLSLSQMQHIAPKKFKTQRPNVNLEEVRNLIKSTQNSDNSAQNNDDDYNLDRREIGR